MRATRPASLGCDFRGQKVPGPSVGRHFVRLHGAALGYRSDRLISSASAIRASIATDLAPSFRIALPRCILTVTSLIESSLATCLFMSPDVTSAITCRSRAVKRP